MKFRNQPKLARRSFLTFCLTVLLFHGQAIAEPLNVTKKARPDTGQLLTAQVQRLVDTHPGRELYFPAGTYLLSHIHLPSGTHIIGDGPGKTIFKDPGLPASERQYNPIVNGAQFYAAVGAVGQRDVLISGITVDLRSADGLKPAGVGNGIAFVPSGTNYSGAGCEHCVVQDCEVLSNYEAHLYHIWNFKSRFCIVKNSVTDAGPGRIFDQWREGEGFECYGGAGNVIIGCTARNMSSAGFNCTSSDSKVDCGPTSPADHLLIQNTAEHCWWGIWLCTSNDPVIGPQAVRGIRVLQNTITDSANAGIQLRVVPGTVIEDIEIRANKITGSKGPAICLHSIGDELAQFSDWSRGDYKWLAPEKLGSAIRSIRLLDNQITDSPLGILKIAIPDLTQIDEQNTIAIK